MVLREEPAYHGVGGKACRFSFLSCGKAFVEHDDAAHRNASHPLISRLVENKPANTICAVYLRPGTPKDIDVMTDGAQVFSTVVCSRAINVVGNLAVDELSPKFALDDNSMQKYAREILPLFYAAICGDVAVLVGVVRQVYEVFVRWGYKQSAMLAFHYSGSSISKATLL